MQGYIKSEILGTLSKDCEITLSKKNNKEYFTFTIPINKEYVNKDALLVKETKWVECLWLITSVKMRKISMKKGCCVLATGEMYYKTYVNSKNETNVSTKMLVDNLTIIGKIEKFDNEIEKK